MGIQHVFTAPGLDKPFDLYLSAMIEIGRAVTLFDHPPMRVETAALRVTNEPWAVGAIACVEVQLALLVPSSGGLEVG